MCPERKRAQPRFMRKRHKPSGRSGRFWLTVMRRLALGLGRGPARLLLYPITLAFLLTGKAEGAASRDYLRRVLGRPPRFIERWRHQFHFASTVLDRLYLLNDQHDQYDQN